jgi:hypothetical protein
MQVIQEFNPQGCIDLNGDTGSLTLQSGSICVFGFILRKKGKVADKFFDILIYNSVVGPVGLFIITVSLKR